MANAGGKVKALEQWCKARTSGYRDVDVRDMAKSWKDGLAFCALIHKYRPDLIHYDDLSKENVFANNQLAFIIAQKELGIPALLDAEDMVRLNVPDRLSIITYVAQYYNYFRDKEPVGGPGVNVAVKRQRTPLDSPEAKRHLQSSLGTGPSTNGMPTTDKEQTLTDLCAVCGGRVYLIERHIEAGQLYHRLCLKQSRVKGSSVVASKGVAAIEDAQVRLSTVVTTPPVSAKLVDTHSQSKASNRIASSEVQVAVGLTEAEGNDVAPSFNTAPLVSAPAKLTGTVVSSAAKQSNVRTQVLASLSAVRATFLDTSSAPNAGTGLQGGGPSLPQTQFSAAAVFQDGLQQSGSKGGFQDESLPQESSSNASRDNDPDVFSAKLAKLKQLRQKARDNGAEDSSGRVARVTQKMLAHKSEHCGTSDTSTVSHSTGQEHSGATGTALFSLTSVSAKPTVPTVINQVPSLPPNALVKHPGQMPSSLPSKAAGTLSNPVDSPVKSASASIDQDPVTRMPFKVVNLPASATRSEKDLTEVDSLSVAEGNSHCTASRQEKKIQTRVLVAGPAATINLTSFEHSPNAQSIPFRPPPRPASTPKKEERSSSMLEGHRDKTHEKSFTSVDMVSPVNASASTMSSVLTPVYGISGESNQLSVATGSPGGDVHPVKPLRVSKKKKQPVDVLSGVPSSQQPALDTGTVPKMTEPCSSHSEALPSSKHTVACFKEYPDDLNPFAGADDAAESKTRAPSKTEKLNANRVSSTATRATRLPRDAYNDTLNPFSSEETDKCHLPLGSATGDNFQMVATIDSPQSRKMLSPDAQFDFESSNEVQFTSNRHRQKALAPPRPSLPSLVVDEESSLLAKGLPSATISPLLSGAAVTPTTARKKKPAPTPPTNQRSSQQVPATSVVMHDDSDGKNAAPKESSADLPAGTPASAAAAEQARLQQKKARPAPPRPMPNQRRSVVCAESQLGMTISEIAKELDVLDGKQHELENRGRALEEAIRQADATLSSSDTDEELLTKWLEIVNEKNQLVRRESELVYVCKQHSLEERQADIEWELRQIMHKPEGQKTDAEKKLEEELLQEMITVVQERNKLVDNLDQDRIRQLEEDKEIELAMSCQVNTMSSNLGMSGASEKAAGTDKRKKKQAKKVKDKK